MKFKPRLTAPSKDNKFYIPDDKGGFNPCLPIGDGTSCLPNCVGYAYGRAMEICGVKIALPTNNAEDWFITAKSKFIVGDKPKLGAIACWKQGKNYNGNDGYGHVAVVEEIYSDSTILTSNSDYFGEEFYLKERKYPYNINGYEFVGFIYLPFTVDNEKDSQIIYTRGNYKVNTDVLNVRKKPTTSSDRIFYNNLTPNAQKQIMDLCGYKCNGYCKGVEFTATEIDGEWGKTPSGWVCLKYCVKI